MILKTLPYVSDVGEIHKSSVVDVVDLARIQHHFLEMKQFGELMRVETSQFVASEVEFAQFLHPWGFKWKLNSLNKYS